MGEDRGRCWLAWPWNGLDLNELKWGFPIPKAFIRLFGPRFPIWVDIFLYLTICHSSFWGRWLWDAMRLSIRLRWRKSGKSLLCRKVILVVAAIVRICRTCYLFWFQPTKEDTCWPILLVYTTHIYIIYEMIWNEVRLLIENNWTLIIRLARATKHLHALARLGHWVIQKHFMTVLFCIELAHGCMILGDGYMMQLGFSGSHPCAEPRLLVMRQFPLALRVSWPMLFFFLRLCRNSKLPKWLYRQYKTR